MVETVAEVLERQGVADRAQVEIVDTRTETGSNESGPTFEVRVSPARSNAARFSVIVWPTGDILVSFGRNGGSVEFDESAGDNPIRDVRSLIDGLIAGRLTERVEIADETETVAVCSEVIDKSGRLVFEIESFEGGTGDSSRIDDYEPFS